ncbi:hypothetical protein Poli38472_006801 [Pythium oligandrum]|uniref:Holocytochrome c-type synthase n=1 Tax=Pythium oligandrum TaxID=41045 RepID=A0A8K1FC43_PYTOL|nr:hypothetical protein Poli38472_006801 [Pythium oligandrum]|eukprot:TMW56791.1 hypothetical protein Poli38472_006801 [Pythium oligandrum]
MTADVNAAAAACPHAAGANKPKKANGEDKSCGFGSQMMDIARHAANGGSWEVTGSDVDLPRLSKDREVSSIPKSDFTPAHQTGSQNKWEYPSEEMYYKAMQRKGWDPEASQMKTIVAIHNSVNEQSWREVRKWESFHPASEEPKLKRFIGRPTDFSPKARLMNMLGWSVLPFDRHDWIVERDGKEVRYVIDFYSGQPEPGKPLSVYLDVRPALDSVESVMDRVRWQFYEKVVPLLPFRGALFGQEQSAKPKADDSNATHGRSTVIPRNSDA